jgi:phage-related protein
MNLFYNRDRNITGAASLTSFDFDPNYGSTVSFSCKKNKYMYNNNSFAMIPSTLNNIVATCNFNFNVNENDAQKMINFFESQSGTGAFAVNDASQIYRTLTGFADSFNVSMANNNQYNITLDFSVERNSSVLNWSGMSFVKYDFVSWDTGQFYQKYQPVYFEIQAQNKLTNFYYATEDHTSSASNAPPNTGYWSQSLFYENDLGLSVETKPMISRNEFKNSFVQRIRDSENMHAIQGLQLTYKNLSDFKLKSILHFLENSLGYKRFQFNLPKIYNRPKLFYAENWQHSWNYKDSNNLTISIVEDPLGIKVQDDIPAFIVGQTPSQTSLSFYSDPKSSSYVIDASGVKEAKTEGSQQINWGSYPIKKLKFYRGLDQLSIYNQQIQSAIFYPRCQVSNCDLSANEITNVSFEGARDVESLNLEANKLSSFNADGVSGLKNINLARNNLSSINISGCKYLTGLNLNSNQISQNSFSTGLLDLALGSGVSGNISVLGDVSFYQINPTPQSGQDYFCISSLDYRNWTQSYKNLSLPIQPTGFVGSDVFTVWLRDSFFGGVTNEYSAKWNSSQSAYNTVQDYTPNPSVWATLNPDQFYKRPAYLFNSSLLTGGVINNTGDYLSAFVVVKFDNSSDQCILNFSPNKDYGLFYNGGTVSFRDGANVNVLTSSIGTQDYYSIGFIRNSTHFTGYVNGVVGNSGTLAVSNLNSIKLSIGGAEGSTPKYFAGNLGEVLAFSNNASFNLNTGFHKPFNARFGIFMP